MSGIDVEDYYQRYGPMVLRRCRQLLKEEALALDAMQDVFVNLLRKQGQLHAQGPSSLLYRMATNTCLNKIDSMARREKHHVADAETGLLERIVSAENVESEVGAVNTLLRLFKRHQESSKTIAVLHLVDGMTLEEKAGTTKNPRQTNVKIGPKMDHGPANASGRSVVGAGITGSVGTSCG